MMVIGMVFAGLGLALACFALGLGVGYLGLRAGMVLVRTYPAVGEWLKRTGLGGAFVIIPFPIGYLGSVWLFHDYILPRVILLL